jgi:hypothetical protein
MLTLFFKGCKALDATPLPHVKAQKHYGHERQQLGDCVGSKPNLVK